MPLPRLLPALSTSLLAATAAFAQTPAPEAPPAAEPRVVTRDELRFCMDGEVSLAARRKQVTDRNAAAQAEIAAIRAEAAQMDEDRRQIRDDEYTKQERFDRRVKVHNARIQAANAATAAVRADLEALNKDVVAYNAGCGRISFRPEDKAAILKEREGKAQ